MAVAGAAGLAAVLVSRALRARQRSSEAVAPAAPSIPEREGVEGRLAALIRIPTVSAAIAETGPEPFERFEAVLRESYPLVFERLGFEQVTPYGMLLHWKGDDPEHPVVLMAHYDVVPAALEDGWTFPPFEGIARDGKVLGRGAIDDKGELVTLLEAVENLLRAGVAPARDLYLSLGGDEESHGLAARQIAQLVRERGIRPWLVVDEGGAVVDPPFPGVHRPMAMVGVSEKGSVSFRIGVTAQGGHASLPGRATAIVELSRALARLRRSPFRATLNTPLRHLISGVGAQGPLWARLITANLWLFSRPLLWGLTAASPEMNALTRTTVAVTLVSGGSADNVLPSSASATLNVRVAPGDSVAAVEARLRRVLGSGFQVETVEPSEPSPISPVEGAQFDAVVDAIRCSYPEAIVSPYVMLQATDSRFFHEFTDHVYRFGPVYLTAKQREGLHGLDEYVTVDSLHRGITFYEALILGLAESTTKVPE